MIRSSDALAEPGDNRPRVLCIGGTDPTGGAGLGADLRVLTGLGVFGTMAVTAVTVQTSRGVRETFGIPASVVRAQAECAMEEPGVDVVKTGMLFSEDVVLAVAELLASRRSVGLVVDPVLRATSGRRLLGEDGLEALKSVLIPRATVVTPNVPELEVLVGRALPSLEAIEWAAEELLLRGASAVLVKGGHFLDASNPEVVTDLVRTTDGDRWTHCRPRHPLNFRGTGCALAAALAAHMAEGRPLRGAHDLAQEYLSRGFEDRSVPGLEGYLLAPNFTRAGTLLSGVP